MINFIVSTIRIIMTWTCKITSKCTLKFKILQLIQCIVETDNNDVYVRDVDIQIQMVSLRTSDKNLHDSCNSTISTSAGKPSSSSTFLGTATLINCKTGFLVTGSLFHGIRISNLKISLFSNKLSEMRQIYFITH